MSTPRSRVVQSTHAISLWADTSSPLVLPGSCCPPARVPGAEGGVPPLVDELRGLSAHLNALLDDVHGSTSQALVTAHGLWDANCKLPEPQEWSLGDLMSAIEHTAATKAAAIETAIVAVDEALDATMRFFSDMSELPAGTASEARSPDGQLELDALLAKLRALPPIPQIEPTLRLTGGVGGPPLLVTRDVFLGTFTIGAGCPKARPGADATFRIAFSDCAMERQGFDVVSALEMFEKYAVVTAVLVLPAVRADGSPTADSETPPRRLPYGIRKAGPYTAHQVVCAVDLCVTAPENAPEGSVVELRAVSLFGTRLEVRLPARVRSDGGGDLHALQLPAASMSHSLSLVIGVSMLSSTMTPLYL